MATSYIVWITIALVCGVVEILTVGFWFLWLALAALLVGLATALRLLSSLETQVLVFAVLTLFFVIFTRPLVLKFFKTREVKSNVDSLVGMSGVVIKEIAPLETGQVKIYGEVWTALADRNIPAGSKVIIRAVEGVKLHVQPLEE
ncbi:MAG: NfeD family protein [Syntrophomonadaceae bacterium]|nr:NfeD family protein [Syntrophomonadaceae bacterium]